MENRFGRIIEEVKKAPVKRRCALVCPDEHTEKAALAAQEMGLIEAVFLTAGKGTGDFHFPSAMEAAREAVTGARERRYDMILKGNIDTAVLLKQVVNKDYGLLTGRLISHVALLDIPAYHKLAVLSDGGMVMYPGREELAGILENAVDVLHALGVEEPKVACLAAVEKVHERMPETVRAAALKKMNQEGLIRGCQVEGPISFDLAFSREAARVKGYDSPVAGDADLFLVPDFVSGNLLAKSLVHAGGARMAGFLSGTRVPVIVTSRSSSEEEKLYSIACSAWLAGRTVQSGGRHEDLGD